MNNKGLNLEQKEYLIQLLKENKDIPEDFKHLLFPTKQKEYELVYAGKMRKEDLLANEDGVFPVPFQVEKIFNGNEYKSSKDDWKNMIVFGDNLQLLKTIYEDKDPLIKGNVKGKIKLIYIDPPFGTGDKYEGNKGQSGYSAKRNNSDFIEFIRRRLILAKEILADDGIIFVRQGYNFGSYIKVVLDEVFGRSNFINEIVVNRGKQRLGGSKKYSTATDTVFLYSKTENFSFNAFKRGRYKGEATGTNMLMKGDRNPPERIFVDPDGNKVTLLPPKNQHWKFVQPKIDEMYKKGVIYLAKSQKGLESGIFKIVGGKKIPVDYVPSFKFDDDKTVDTNWTDISGYSQDTGYPTENSEDLLYRVISTGINTNEDIVFDFFGGSGTTAAVAEKLGCRWITCDLGKLAYLTIQRRILQIQNSKDLINPKVKYNKKARSFMTCTLGLYDLKKALNLEWNKYLEFVSSLFEIDIKSHKISGYEFEGKKGNYPVKIWDYNTHKNSNIDDLYLKKIHESIGNKVSGRVYIIAPANNIDFLTDYQEIGDVRYYFLKIPYQVIKELHKIPFQKLRQPQSKKNVNDLDDAIGFHFIKAPEVKSVLKKTDTKIEILIKEFKSQYYKDEDGQVLENFETLSSVFLDKEFDGKQFIMSDYFFADDLIPKNSKSKKKGLHEDSNNDVRKDLKDIKSKGLVMSFDKKDVGKKIMIVYTDIYGNDFTEILTV
jgi:DNA modification methylase